MAKEWSSPPEMQIDSQKLNDETHVDTGENVREGRGKIPKSL